MKKSVIQPVLAFLVMAAVLMGSVHAQPAEPVNKPTKTKTKTKKKMAKTAVTVPRATARFVPGSAETAGQRSARLTRECKGQVNAGACAGYTR